MKLYLIYLKYKIFLDALSVSHHMTSKRQCTAQ